MQLALALQAAAAGPETPHCAKPADVARRYLELYDAGLIRRCGRRLAKPLTVERLLQAKPVRKPSAPRQSAFFFARCKAARKAARKAAKRIAAPVRQRPIPRDFEARYLELGLKGCAEHYGAWNRTVRRWLEALGREQLRARRIEVVQAKRRAAAARRVNADQRRHAEARRRAVTSAEPMPPADVIRDAAHFLRTPKGGRNLVSPSGHGDWFVGSVRVTPQDLVRRAKAKGFGQ